VFSGFYDNMYFVAFSKFHVFITDIDECTAEGYTCGDNNTAHCTNIVGGGFTCDCRPGFKNTYHNETVILCTGMNFLLCSMLTSTAYFCCALSKYIW